MKEHHSTTITVFICIYISKVTLFDSPVKPTYFVGAASVKEILLLMHQQEIKRVKVSPIHDKVLELKDLYVPLRIQKHKADYSIGNEDLKSLTDMFILSNGNLDGKIFVTGESGCGKTMLCLKLLESWVKGNEMHHCPVGTLEKYLAENFSLVFYVALRDSREGTASLVDMVCESVSNGDPQKIQMVKYALNSSNINCLVIVDGLDEWKRTNTLHVPDTYGLVNCVLFYTTRPWVLSNMQLKLNDNDAVYDVLGLDPNCIRDMVSNVLINICGLEKTSNTYQGKCEKYSKSLKPPHLNSILNPMILFYLIQLQNEEDASSQTYQDLNPRVNRSITQISLSMIEVMIQRADRKDDSVKSYINQRKKSQHILFENIPGFSYMKKVDNCIIAIL